MSFDQWLTDPKVLSLVREVFNGSIDYDPASNIVAQEYVQAKEFCVDPNGIDGIDTWGYGDCPADNMHFDGLKGQWKGNTFVNPPYSAGNIDKFVERAIYHWDTRDHDVTNPDTIHQMIMLVNSSTDCGWYHTLLNSCDTVLLYKGRIKFWKIMPDENGRMKAYEKWEGEKSKSEGKGKIGNSPRYLSTLFYFGRNSDRFREAFKEKGTFLQVKR